MKPTSSALTAALAASLTLFAASATLPPAARAAYTFMLSQVGADVVASGSGTLNVSALTLSGTTLFNPTLSPDVGLLELGPRSASVSLYRGISGPASFGGGGQIAPSPASGDAVGLGGGTTLYVPSTFSANSTLYSFGTFANQTFNSLGITPGTYVYTWGTGATADSLTVRVVPEPSTYALALVGAVALVGLGQRFRRAATRRT